MCARRQVDAGKFIQTCPAKRIPVSPVFGMPKTFITKDVLKENGLGIHVLKDVCTEAGGCVKFIQTCPAKRIPVSPVLGMPRTLIQKPAGVSKEMGRCAC